MKVYIIEDDDSMRIILKRLLKKHFQGVEVKESATAEQALDEIPIYNPELVLVDISLPGMNGIELISILKPKCFYICILVVTGHEVEVYKKAALDAGAHDIISKMEDAKLIQSVKELSEKRKHGGCD
jgi:DNA-binding NarL/FixJ family response regulator